MRKWPRRKIWVIIIGYLCDARDLNYDKYFVEGQEKVSKFEDYHSHNTHRLDVDGMKQLLLKLDMIKEDVCLK